MILINYTFTIKTGDDVIRWVYIHGDTLDRWVGVCVFHRAFTLISDNFTSILSKLSAGRWLFAIFPIRIR